MENLCLGASIRYRSCRTFSLDGTARKEGDARLVKSQCGRDGILVSRKIASRAVATIPMIGQLGRQTVAWARSQEYSQITSVIGPQRGPNAALRLTCTPHAPHSTYNPNPPRRC